MENRVDSHFDDNSNLNTNGRQDETWSVQIATLNGVLASEDNSIDATGDLETKKKAIEEIKTQFKSCIKTSETNANVTAPVVPIHVVSQPEETEHRGSVPDPSFFTNSLPTEKEMEEISKRVQKHQNLNLNRKKSKLSK